MPVYVAAFESTHAAMAAGKAFERAGIAHATIPTPTAISAGCGIAHRFEAVSDDRARRLLSDLGVDGSSASLHRMESRTSYVLV